MPNRIIKESICESVGLTECSVFAQDLYKRLITYADDYGRFNADTMIMRAKLFPREYDAISEEDILDALIELVGNKKIAFYTPVVFNQHGKSGIYGAFPNWSEHQRIRESKKKCPDPSDTQINDWYLRRFISKDLKRAVLERDGMKCTICGKYLTSSLDIERFLKLGHGLYHIDHIVPVIQGGRATLENLRLTCPKCNLKRKKAFTFMDLLRETDNGTNVENLPQIAASRGNPPPESNPIQSESEYKSESNPTPHTPRGGMSKAQEQAFEAFWTLYPRKKSKGQARIAWKKLNPSGETISAIMDKLPLLIASKEWTKDGGQYIPYPATWLRAAGWEDEIDAQSAENTGQAPVFTPGEQEKRSISALAAFRDSLKEGDDK